MPDTRCDELSGVGIYHDAKPGQVNDATDYSPWKLKSQCKTRDFGQQPNSRYWSQFEPSW